MAGLPTLTTNQVLERLDQSVDTNVVDLSRVDFRHVDTRDLEFRSKFSTATQAAASNDTGPVINLTASNISGCDFSHYDLSHVILSRVVARHTVFTGSNFTDTKVDDADLDYADLRSATLRYAKFNDSSIYGANLEGADLSNTHGLSLARPGAETVRRLGVVASIRGATLPADVEKYRDVIENLIAKNNPRKRAAREPVKLRQLPPQSEDNLALQTIAEIGQGVQQFFKNLAGRPVEKEPSAKHKETQAE